jgi:hypothetical protein
VAILKEVLDILRMVAAIRIAFLHFFEALFLAAVLGLWRFSAAFEMALGLQY